MYAHNTRIVLQGQDKLPHTCLGCMHIFKSPDGGLHRTEVIVTDGVTAGCPCCAIPRCKNPLDNNRLRFCAKHHHLEAHKACDDPVHLCIEAVNINSSRHGKSKTQRQKLSKLNDAITVHLPPTSTDDVPLQDVEEWYEHDVASGAVRLCQVATTTSTGVSNHPVASDLDADGCSAKDTPPKLKATFHCQHTNNKQLVVRPCGVICGRGTMYHHETVSNVLIMIEKMFTLPRAHKLQHMIYNSNCNALHEVESRKIAFFEGMGMCVDAFHHRTKHKASDVLCHEHCDMKAYPELLDDNEMMLVKYDFFLDEMILHRNLMTVATLQKQNKLPHHPPVL
ncbi:hypothetical protein F4604DRAFT_1927056 [Suillus subluteus]|nr:hypothetical protein F4604DRAFT_1927056 [Suillus subluteus]